MGHTQVKKRVQSAFRNHFSFLRKNLLISSKQFAKVKYQNQQHLEIWSIMRIHGCLLKNLVIDKVQNFCWILEKVVFPSEMPLFVGSCYFEFPDPFALFTSLFSTLTFLILFLISENASFPLRISILWTGVFSKNSWNFLVPNFGDRQISENCQLLEEISFPREMRHFIRPWYFEFPDPFKFSTANFV